MINQPFSGIFRMIQAHLWDWSILGTPTYVGNGPFVECLESSRPICRIGSYVGISLVCNAELLHTQTYVFLSIK